MTTRIQVIEAGRIASALLLMTFIAACGSGSDGPDTAARTLAPGPAPVVTPPSQQPNRPGGRYTVDGEVFAFETGVLGGVPVNLWVQQAGFGYSWWWANGPLIADQLGRFVAGNVPDANITILAYKDGYAQPCSVTAAVRGNVSVRIEMVPISSLDVFNPPRPQLSGEPTLTGVVYETTSAGRQPVAGAVLWVERTMDTIAGTVSDRGGGYFLCNLGRDVALYVSKPGFVQREVGPIDGTESRVLDIELRRQ